MKKLLCAALVLAMLLAGCGKKEQTPEPTPAPSAPTQTTQQPEPSAPQPTVPETPAVPTDWPKADLQGAADYLVGSWHCYQPSAYADVMWVELYEDGTYEVAVDSGAGMWGWDDEKKEFPVYTYTGEWHLEDWNSEEYLLCMSLAETDDPDFNGMNSLGDYLVSQISICDGEELIHFNQANNGDGLYTRWFMDLFDLALERPAQRKLTQTVQKNATFLAQIWKNSYQPYFALFVDDVELAEDGTVINDVRESVKYRVGSGEGVSELSGGPDGLFSLGDGVYELTTDKNGFVTWAEYVPSGPAPDEDTALQMLQNNEEVLGYLEQNMLLLYEGWEQLNDNQYCARFALGTEGEGHVVWELRYAVNKYGWVYRYDPVLDDWEYVS